MLIRQPSISVWIFGEIQFERDIAKAKFRKKRKRKQKALLQNSLLLRPWVDELCHPMLTIKNKLIAGCGMSRAPSNSIIGSPRLIFAPQRSSSGFSSHNLLTFHFVPAQFAVPAVADMCPFLSIKIDAGPPAGCPDASPGLAVVVNGDRVLHFVGFTFFQT